MHGETRAVEFNKHTFIIIIIIIIIIFGFCTSDMKLRDYEIIKTDYIS